MILESQKITSVKSLIEALNSKQPGSTYLSIMKSIGLEIKDFEEYFSWNDENYTRNCLAKTDNYELLIICWEKGQKSVIHDYDTREAWIHPILGKLREEKFRLCPDTGNLEKVSSVILGTSEFSFINKNSGIHRYSNIYEARSISLHLYANPVHEWNVYNEFTAESSRKKVNYDNWFHLENN